MILQRLMTIWRCWRTSKKKKDLDLFNQEFEVPLDKFAGALKNVKARLLPSASDRRELKLGGLERLIRQKEEEVALRKKLKRLEELEAELNES